MPWIPRPGAFIPASFRETLTGLCRAVIPWPLLIFGGPGTGKTTCALKACDLLYPCYWTMADLIKAEQFNEARRRRGEYNPENPWPRIAGADFAVLDEIGQRGREKEFEYSVLMNFIEERNKKNRVAIYITNLDPETLAEAFDERIADRLTCGTILSIDGESKRWGAHA